MQSCVYNYNIVLAVRKYNSVAISASSIFRVGLGVGLRAVPGEVGLRRGAEYVVTSRRSLCDRDHTVIDW